MIPEIVFTVRLTADDWDDAMHGWRCHVLNVPGAVVDAVYVEGSRIDTARYEVLTQNTFIRWMAPDQPQRAAASIKLTEALSLGKDTERWKRLAIILPVVATIAAAAISGAATYLSRKPDFSRVLNAPSREYNQAPPQPDRLDGREAQSGDWAIMITDVSYTSEYKPRFKRFQRTLAPSARDHKLVVVQFTLHNVSVPAHTFSPDFLGDDTGLVDDADSSYPPLDWDVALKGDPFFTGGDRILHRVGTPGTARYAL